MVPKTGIEPVTRGFSIFPNGFDFTGRIRAIALRFNALVAVFVWRFPAVYIQIPVLVATYVLPRKGILRCVSDLQNWL